MWELPLFCFSIPFQFILFIYFPLSNELTSLWCNQVLMMLSAGYFRIRSALPGPVWMYPVSYIAFHTFSIQVSCNTFYIIWWQLTKKSRVYLPYFFSLQLNLDTLYFIRPKMSVPLKEQTGPNSHFPFSMELLITFASYHVSTYSPMTTWSSSITYSSCSSLVGEKKLYLVEDISWV